MQVAAASHTHGKSPVSHIFHQSSHISLRDWLRGLGETVRFKFDDRSPEPEWTKADSRGAAPQVVPASAGRRQCSPPHVAPRPLCAGAEDCYLRWRRPSRCNDYLVRTGRGTPAAQLCVWRGKERSACRHTVGLCRTSASPIPLTALTVVVVENCLSCFNCLGIVVTLWHWKKNWPFKS